MYELNNVYNLDSFEAYKNIDINDEYVIVIDPPYNVGYHYNSYKDNKEEEEFYNDLVKLIKDKQAVVLMYPEMLHKLSIKLGYPPVKVVSWVYNAHTPKEHRDICFYNIKPDFSKVKQPYKNLKDKRIQEKIRNGSKGANIYDWWNIQQVKNVNFDKYNHPCQIPFKVMENIIGILPEEKIILDFFSGSGTTLLAAKELNRKFIGFEIDKEYVKICKDRLNGVLPNGQCSLIFDRGE